MRLIDSDQLYSVVLNYRVSVLEYNKYLIILILAVIPIEQNAK